MDTDIKIIENHYGLDQLLAQHIIDINVDLILPIKVIIYQYVKNDINISGQKWHRRIIRLDIWLILQFGLNSSKIQDIIRASTKNLGKFKRVLSLKVDTLAATVYHEHSHHPRCDVCGNKLSSSHYGEEVCLNSNCDNHCGYRRDVVEPLMSSNLTGYSIRKEFSPLNNQDVRDTIINLRFFIKLYGSKNLNEK